MSGDDSRGILLLYKMIINFHMLCALLEYRIRSNMVTSISTTNIGATGDLPGFGWAIGISPAQRAGTTSVIKKKKKV